MKYLIAILADDEAIADLLEEGVQPSAEAIAKALREDMTEEDGEHLRVKVVASDHAEPYFDSIAEDAAS